VPLVSEVTVYLLTTMSVRKEEKERSNVQHGGGYVRWVSFRVSRCGSMDGQTWKRKRAMREPELNTNYMHESVQRWAPLTWV
jgi:hypothetical protein